MCRFISEPRISLITPVVRFTGQCLQCDSVSSLRCVGVESDGGRIMLIADDSNGIVRRGLADQPRCKLTQSPPLWIA